MVKTLSFGRQNGFKGLLLKRLHHPFLKEQGSKGDLFMMKLRIQMDKKHWRHLYSIPYE
jgi:hypothetical protein